MIQNILKTSALLCGLSLFALQGTAQSTFELVDEVPANLDNEPAPVHPLPHPRQVEWMRTEFYGFFHYGMNTFTANEWGNKLDAPTSTYAPTKMPNPRQWLEVAQSAHMKGGIAVVKHHDGFCLWPTKTTDYNINGAGNEFGRTANIPELFGKAAQELGMKYGFYVSPWDAHDYRYGTEEYVNEVFLQQCKELAQYGDDQFEMWFDGANGGEGKYGGTTVIKREIDRASYYDVPNLRDLVHRISPNCVLWGVGGEARWIGNEEGKAGETNWCPDNREEGKDQPNAASGNENGWMWLPGESDAKATNNGWFWKSSDTMKSKSDLFKMYLETVGRNSTFILNIPPDKNGEIPETFAKRMKELGDLLDTRLSNNKAKLATVTATNTRADGANRTYSVSNLVDDDIDSYFATEDGVKDVSIIFEFPETQKVYYVMLQEHIQLGQRVKAFNIETSEDGETWKTFGGTVPTTTIGYKRIIPKTSTTSYGYQNAKYVRVNITDAKACVTLDNIAIY